MRTATIYNFLLEANLMASVAVLLMIMLRKFLRKPLGNRLIYVLWLFVAIRLLCPLALSSPLVNEFRPEHLDDAAIRPIAGQIKIRITDIFDDIRWKYRINGTSFRYEIAGRILDGMRYGTLSRLLIRIYLYGAGVVLLLFGAFNVRFRHEIRINRIERISGKLEQQYVELCKEHKVKPIPVWLADPLPSACLVGTLKPYIVLPVSAAPKQAMHMLAHELCHYKKKDHWSGVLRLLCCVIHWFNPLVWAAATMSRTDGELACDSRVVRQLSPEERKEYGATLLNAAAKRYAPSVGVLATGMTMTGRKLQRRVQSILRYQNAVKWLAVTLAVLACMALVMSFVTADGTVDAAKYLSPISGFGSVTAGPDGVFSHLPGGNDISLEDAVEIAVEGLEQQYHISGERLVEFSLTVDFMEYYWSIWMHDTVFGRTYEFYIDSSDGRIMDSCWGNG